MVPRKLSFQAQTICRAIALHTTIRQGGVFRHHESRLVTPDTTNRGRRRQNITILQYDSGWRRRRLNPSGHSNRAAAFTVIFGGKVDESALSTFPRGRHSLRAGRTPDGRSGYYQNFDQLRLPISRSRVTT